MNAAFTKIAKQAFSAVIKYFKDHPEQVVEIAQATKSIYSEVAKNAKKKQASATK